MFTDNAVRDLTAAGYKLLGMNFFSKKNTVVLFQDCSVLAHATETLSPFAMANADCRQAKLVLIKRFIDIKEAYRHCQLL